jgi:hypothetical protein
MEMDELLYLGWCQGRVKPILVHSSPASRKEENCCRDAQKAACNGEQFASSGYHGRMCFMPNACVSDKRQRETVSGVKSSVEAASCSLDAMVRHPGSVRRASSAP